MLLGRKNDRSLRTAVAVLTSRRRNIARTAAAVQISIRLSIYWLFEKKSLLSTAI
jgi:hypothetical protein